MHCLMQIEAFTLLVLLLLLPLFICPVNIFFSIETHPLLLWIIALGCSFICPFAPFIPVAPWNCVCRNIQNQLFVIATAAIFIICVYTHATKRLFDRYVWRQTVAFCSFHTLEWWWRGWNIKSIYAFNNEIWNIISFSKYKKKISSQYHSIEIGFNGCFVWIFGFFSFAFTVEFHAGYRVNRAVLRYNNDMNRFFSK